MTFYIFKNNIWSAYISLFHTVIEKLAYSEIDQATVKINLLPHIVHFRPVLAVEINIPVNFSTRVYCNAFGDLFDNFPCPKILASRRFELGG